MVYVVAGFRGWYRPAVHELHDVTLLDTAYCPFGQDLQLVDVYVVATF